MVSNAWGGPPRVPQAQRKKSQKDGFQCVGRSTASTASAKKKISKGWFPMRGAVHREYRKRKEKNLKRMVSNAWGGPPRVPQAQRKTSSKGWFPMRGAVHREYRKRKE